MKGRWIKGIGGLVALLCILSLIQTEVKAEPEGNIYLGPVEVHPFISLKEVYDDNIYLTPANKRNDFITTISPGIKLKLPVRKHKFELKYQADIIEYADYSRESVVHHTFSGLADLKLTRGFSLKFDETFKKTSDPADSERTARRDRIRNEAIIGLGYKKNRLAFDLKYTNLRDDYEASNQLDKYEHISTITGYYRILPKTDLLLEYDYGVITYDESVRSDADYHQIRSGLKGDLTGKLAALIKVGYQRRGYQDSSKKGFEGTAVIATLTEKFTARTQAILSAERSVNESGYSVNNYYELNKIGLKLEQKLGHKLSLSVKGSYQLNRYPEETTEAGRTAKREDEFWGGDIGLKYQIQEWLSAGMGYEYKERNSNLGTFDYENNKATVEFSVAF